MGVFFEKIKNGIKNKEMIKKPYSVSVWLFCYQSSKVV